jgi:hypothetical protein
MAFLPYLAHLPILPLFRSKLRGNALFLIIKGILKRTSFSFAENLNQSRQESIDDFGIKLLSLFFV